MLSQNNSQQPHDAYQHSQYDGHQSHFLRHNDQNEPPEFKVQHLHHDNESERQQQQKAQNLASSSLRDSHQQYLFDFSLVCFFKIFSLFYEINSENALKLPCFSLEQKTGNSKAFFPIKEPENFEVF